MKESKKYILNLLKKENKKANKFEELVLNLALQKLNSDSYEFDGEAVYTVDKKCLIYCLSTKDSFTIPEGVEIIGEMAFRGKKTLKNVIIPSTVKQIQKNAFDDCDGLDNVLIPASVETVNGYAFFDCDSLKNITFLGTPSHLSRHTFDACDDIHKIIVPAGAADYFKKKLHYHGEEDDYQIVAKPSDENTETETTDAKKETLVNVDEEPKDAEEPANDDTEVKTENFKVEDDEQQK